MKTVRIILLRIQQYFYTNKLVLIIFLLGGILCSLIFIYFYGNLVTVKSLSGGEEYVLRNYELYFHSPISKLSTEQLNILNKYSSDRLTVLSHVNPQKLDSDDLGVSLKTEFNRNGYFIIESSLLDTNGISVEAGRVQFTEDEIKEGKAVVILPPDFLSSTKIPKSISISGTEYEVIGITGSSNNLHIPYTVFNSENFDIFQISIILSNMLTDSENFTFEEELKEAFPTAELKGTSDFKESLSQNTPTEIIYICEIYLLSMLTFMILMKYLVDVHRKDDIILSLVGATKKRVMKITILQNICITFCTALISILLHVLLKNSLFEYINIQPNIQYGFIDYFIVLILILVLSVIVQLPFLFSFYKGSLIDLKQKYLMED